MHQGKPVIFHCKSGARTKANAPRLAGKFGDACEAFIVEGGLDAWRKAGLPVVSDRNQPLEIQRQVQIGAGSLAVPAFVGAGLITAGPHRLLRHGPHSDASTLEPRCLQFVRASRVTMPETRSRPLCCR